MSDRLVKAAKRVVLAGTARGSATVVRGDALHLPLPDESVDLVCTSPPYFGLRSYQDGGEHYDGQLGSEATPVEFVDALLEATREMARVLKPSGSIWINLGDKYAGSGGGGEGSSDGQNGRHARPPRRATVVPTKSLMGIPWRYALRCIDDLELILRAEVIWVKPNGLPESATDRVHRSHEQWFHFTRRPRYYSAVDEIREETQPTRPNALTWDQRRSGAGRVYGADTGMRGHTSGGGGMAPHPRGKLPSSVWSIATQPLTVPSELGVDHYAAFPMELCRRIITGWSPRHVCTACGEGRRPAVDKGAGVMGVTSATIAGYACACTPYTDHPGGGAGSGGWGAYDGDNARGPAPTGKQHVPANYGIHTGPWCEYHWNQWSPAPATPGLVLDPFGGSGTTAAVAKALGRNAIAVDMSGDYCRLATWRTNDPSSIAHAVNAHRRSALA